MKKPVLLVLLAIATPVLVDQAAVDKCVETATKKLRANEEAARRSSSESLTRQHQRLFDERIACRKKLKEPPKSRGSGQIVKHK